MHLSAIILKQYHEEFGDVKGCVRADASFWMEIHTCWIQGDEESHFFTVTLRLFGMPLVLTCVLKFGRYSTSENLCRASCRVFIPQCNHIFYFFESEGSVSSSDSTESVGMRGNTSSSEVQVFRVD